VPRVFYYVVLDQSEWKIRLNNQDYGPYRTQEAAFRAAVDAAQGSGKNGQAAKVLVRGEDHKFRTKWTYGQDPYPPQVERGEAVASPAP
jgi:Uncharacterized protein conserved in bacteria (DUF2188)